MLLFHRGLAIAAVSAFTCCCSLRADFLPISQPNATYLQDTTPLDFADPDYTQVGALFGGGERLFYDNLLQELTVPTSWAAWGNPPATESATPRVGFTQGSSELTILLSAPASTFGLEIEPNNQSPDLITADFYSGTKRIGTISLTPDGGGGALLYAAATTTNPFTSVVINDLQPTTPGDVSDFAIAEQRVATVTPEPASLALATLAAAAALFGRRRSTRRLAPDER